MADKDLNRFEMSWVPKINKAKRPIYLELATTLERDIKNGVIRPGTKLPPQRELADYLGINLSTVSKAVQVCMRKGLISASVGSGTYVSYDALVENGMPRRSRSIIDMGASQPESGGFDEIAMAIKTMTSEPNFDEWLGYADIDGIPWHREAAARLIARTGFIPNPENILFSAGSQNGLAAILCALFQRGDRIITDPFTYYGLIAAAKLFGLELIPVTGRDGIMDEQSINKVCAEMKIKGLYVMPGNQMPDVELLPDERKAEIAAAAKKNGLIVIEDSVNLLHYAQPKASVAQYLPEQTVFLASISKTFAPGLRFAALVCPDAYLEAVETALRVLNRNISPFLEELACRLIVSDRAQSIISQHDKSMVARTGVWNEILGKYLIDGGPQSLHRWIRMPTGVDEMDFEKKAAILGVIVMASGHLAVGDTKPYNAVRITPSAPATVWKLKEGLKILRQLLDSLSGMGTVEM